MSAQNRSKGYLAEQATKEWLKTHPNFKSFTNIHQPENDKGIDFVADSFDKKVAVQVKNYASKVIDYKDVATFLDLYEERQYDLGLLVVFGEGKITAQLKGELNQLNIEFFDGSEVINFLEDKKNKAPTRLKKDPTVDLLPHQKEALEGAVKHYETNDRGILEMACGTGKTFVSKSIMKTLLPQGGVVFYFVPWLNLLEQSMHYFDDPDTYVIPVCSKEKEMMNSKGKTDDSNVSTVVNVEHLLNPENFQLLRDENRYVIVFCTYQSYERIAEKQKNGSLMAADLMISDEAHHTVPNDKSKNFTFHDDIKAKKALYMTATVKIYEPNPNSKTHIKDNYDMSTADIYGKTFYSLPLGEAIKRDILVDYDVIIPRFNKDATEDVLKKLIEKDQLKYLNIDKRVKQPENTPEEKEAAEKYYLNEKKRKVANMIGIYEAMKKSGSQSAISFVGSHVANRARKSMEAMEIIIKHLNEMDGGSSSTSYDLKTDYIEGIMSPKRRQEKLVKLTKETPFLLWNCRCLTEGVDIPSCDTIAFFDAKSSYIDIVQAVGRALRKDPNNPNKKATIILPLVMDDIDIIPVDENIFTLYASILKADGRDINTNPNVAEKNTDKHVRKSNANFLQSTSKTTKTNDEEAKQKNAKLIKYLSSKIYLEVSKMSNITWQAWISNMKSMITKVRNLIDQKSTKKYFEEISREFGQILSYDKQALNKEKTIEVLTQYVAISPIFKNIYKVDFALSADFDNYLTKLGIYQQVNAIAKETTDDFCKELDSLSTKDQDHLFTQVYNGLLKAIYPDLTVENGMWHTPSWVIEHLWKILEHVSDINWNKAENIQIIDPAAGTGAFMVHFFRQVLPEHLIESYYQNNVNMREIEFIPYLINIFRLAMAAGQEKLSTRVHWGDSLKHHKNNNSVKKEESAIINQNRSETSNFTIIITNPPWRGGQKEDVGKTKELYISKNDDDKNDYWVDERIQETFIQKTNKSNKRSLYNMYRRFVRWSLDHSQSSDEKNPGKGWTAMVLPNQFLYESVEGFRRSLTEECDEIYIVNLKGKSGIGANTFKEGENIFKTETQTGNTQGVALLLCFQNAENKVKQNKTYYAEVPDGSSNKDKDNYLKDNYKKSDFFKLITLNEEGHWFFKDEEAPKKWQPLAPQPNYKLPITKDKFYFKQRDDGIVSGLDDFVYGNSVNEVKNKMKPFIDYYNVCRENKEAKENPSVIKWHDVLRRRLINNIPIVFDENKITKVLRRPFKKEFLYLEPSIIKSLGNQHKHYAKTNISLCVSFSTEHFSVLMVDKMPDLHIFPQTKCFPMSEIIPREPYNDKEWMAILYAVLNHSEYQEKAKNFLRNNLPTIPPLTDQQTKELLQVGQKLMDLHLNYEKCEPSEIIDIKTKDNIPSDYIKYRSMKYYIPQKALQYKLQGQPMVFKSRDSYLLPQLVTVALKTVDLMQELDQIKLDLE
ncbi:type ISP restriction/modification enzyme [Candidatus Phytoplasma pruni]|nr:type ISP restriction/modification enzyme [Candidatus Phytoplasma pruni]